MGEGVTYHVASAGDQRACGMMQQRPGTESMPTTWGVYFNVDDVDASAALVTELGGKVPYGVYDIPGIGRMAVVRDPQGATFCLFRPSMEA